MARVENTCMDFAIAEYSCIDKWSPARHDEHMEIVDKLIQKHGHYKDMHITRVMCCWVVVSEGRVVDVDRSQALDQCPMQSAFSTSGVAEYTLEKMRQFGHFSPKRQLTRNTIAVPYGASEMLMYAMEKGVLDCAVTVCDGAGTVVSTEPSVVQGIGARMNGLFYTTPIVEIQDQLRAQGCVVNEDAKIDQLRGAQEAVSAGCSGIGITVNLRYGDNLERLREFEKEAGVSLTLIGICSTGTSEARSREAVKHADIVWACASKFMRKAGCEAILQVTQGIPINVYTEKGLEFLAAYSDDEGASVLRELDLDGQYLLHGGAGDKKIVLGKHRLSLRKTELPVAGKRGPTPLR